MTNAEARFNKIHIRKVYACLAVTCHLHFWQNDRDFLRATAVTRGWNGYRNKSQHRKSTLEKKILPPFQQGFEPATFQSRVRCSKWRWPSWSLQQWNIETQQPKNKNKKSCSIYCAPCHKLAQRFHAALYALTHRRLMSLPPAKVNDNSSATRPM